MKSLQAFYVFGKFVKPKISETFSDGAENLMPNSSQSDWSKVVFNQAAEVLVLGGISNKTQFYDYEHNAPKQAERTNFSSL